MANLTITAYWTRKGIKYGAIALVCFLIFRAIWQAGTAYWLKIHPPPPLPPTVGFGKLPPLKFPEKKDLPSLSYKLETIEGTASKLETIGKVYFIPKKVASLLALDRTKETARKLGFRNEPTPISEKIYQFTAPATTLTIDIITGNFKLSYDWKNDQTIFVEKKLPNETQAVSELKNFLRTAGLLADDLASGETKVSFWRYVTPDLVSAISLSEADFVKVNLFRQNLDDLKILPENPQQAQVWALFSGTREPNKRIVELNYTYSLVDKENFHTYPLKSANSAWQELQSEEGFVANLGENQEGKIVIRKIYLAYFESSEAQNFLQPIFVFEGDKGFFAYVSAVDPKWVE